MNSLSAAILRDRLAATPHLRLIDVLPHEHFDLLHLPRASNACVYEMSFLDQVGTFASPSDPIVVYGASSATREARVAVEKLTAAGYHAVEEFPGGLAEWEAAGFPLDRGPAAPVPPLEGIFKVDPARSLIRWTGRNLFNHHEGTIRLTGGTVRFEADRITDADFAIDLDSIACDDLTDSTMAATLIRHLRDDDFFAVSRFPTAHFCVRKAEPITENSPGRTNFLLCGDLTVRGETHSFELPAVIAAKNNDEVVGQAQIAFDRTLWGAVYGSGKFFAFLGPHVVNDLVDLHLKIFAVRASS